MYGIEYELEETVTNADCRGMQLLQFKGIVDGCDIILLISVIMLWNKFP